MTVFVCPPPRIALLAAIVTASTLAPAAGALAQTTGSIDGSRRTRPCSSSQWHLRESRTSLWLVPTVEQRADPRRWTGGPGVDFEQRT